MTKNLIEGGIIEPSRWPEAKVKREIAAILKIKIEEIERIDYWVKQIWVKIVGKGPKFVSYRKISFWFKDGLAAIENCQDAVQFEKLGAMLREEMEHHGKHYPPDILAKLQKAWQKKTPQFQTDEARLQLKIAHHKEAIEWQRHWEEILAQCEDYDSLREYYWKILEESEAFEDLPDVVYEVNQYWEKRRKDFDRPEDFSGDFWTPF